MHSDSHNQLVTLLPEISMAMYTDIIHELPNKGCPFVAFIHSSVIDVPY